MLIRMAVELNDTALMMRYRDGDMTAFETLYARHRGPLFRFVMRQLGNQQRTEDVFQETWARLVRNRATYRPTAKFNTYLYRIARNCVIDQYRKTGRRAAVIVPQDNDMAEPQATTGDPLEAAGQAETGTALLTALQGLPDDQREAFLLKEECGLSLEDIGTVTGVGRETVKSRLRYAVDKLRQCLPTPAEARIND
jgi:RNA polymerase sigma-70 factor (ECF subfamily)